MASLRDARETKRDTHSHSHSHSHRRSHLHDGRHEQRSHRSRLSPPRPAESRTSPSRSRSRSRSRKARCRPATRPIVLPYHAAELRKRDLERYRPLFASYLDIQKGLDIDELDEAEVKGRWKSFIGKWNRGELAEGWYQPATLKKAIATAAEMAQSAPRVRRPSPAYLSRERSGRDGDGDGDEDRSTPRDGADSADEPSRDQDDSYDSDDQYGPTLPSVHHQHAHPHSHPHREGGALAGPTHATPADIRLKHEDERQAREAAYDDRRAALAAERRAHKAALKELQEEVAPRAEPGTRERRLEKRREVISRWASSAR
ncbi:hypothetical protein KEM52_002478 [Ascosphaera acerosa]|nr:hypothetical protein KEM52_002478 [Ascosphaera acerosa]